MNRKLVSIALALTTTVWLVGPIANAQTTASIQAQIAQLMAQIQALQSQLNTAGGSTTSATFTRNLTVGSKGTDVSALQQVLISGGFLKITAPTAYFGPATKAALMAWQTANNVSPASGYFGPKSRAAIAGSVATTGGTTTGGTTTGGVTAPASGLLVSLASDNPVGGSLLGGSSRNRVLSFNLTAGTGSAATVTQVQIHKAGVVADNNITGAYLTQSGKVVAQYTSISGGIITFAGLNLSIMAGQTQKFGLSLDIPTGLGAGNTVSFSINGPQDINSIDASGNAITETGTFPLLSNTFTTASVTTPPVATLTITSSTVGQSVYAGTQGALVSQWTVSAGNNPVNLSSINFRVVGSASKSDIRNVKLMVNGIQVGQTLATVDPSGSAFFDLSSTPARLNTGTSNMQVIADIMGSPSFAFQFELLNAYDVYALDSQYNVAVPPTINGGAGVVVNILTGQLTVTLSTDTPTSNVAKGQSNVQIARFKVSAAGEALRVKFLSFQITEATSGALAANLPNEIRNVQLVDDQGIQVGSTISTPLATTPSCDVSGTPTTANVTSGGVYTDCFGTSASPINYTVPANTTRILSLKVDIQTGADFTSIKGALAGNSNNLQGITSSQLNNTNAASGNALTLAASSLSTAINTSLGSQNLPKSSSNQRIGSYVLTASTAEGVNIQNLSILLAGAGANLANLYVKIGGTQFGTIYGALSNTTYTFSGTPAVLVPAGGSVTVDVYADILSSIGAGPFANVTTLSSCSGSGAVSFSSVSCANTPGQTLSIGAASSLVLSTNSNTAGTNFLVMGLSQVPLASFNFTETSNVEDAKVTDLSVFQRVATSTTATKSGFQNMTMYYTDITGNANASVVSSPAVASANVQGTDPNGAGYVYKFHMVTPLWVPKGNTATFTIKGDTVAYNPANVTDNATSTFLMGTTTDAGNSATSTSGAGFITALGITSNAPVNLSFLSGNSAVANTMTVVRAKVQVTAAGLGTATNRNKGTNSDIGSLTITSTGGTSALNKIVVTFSGTAPSSTTFIGSGNVVLFDTGTQLQATGYTLTSSTACSGTAATCTAIFTFGAGTAGFQISPNSPKVFNVRIINENGNTATAAANTSVTLGATINAVGDITYTDGLDSNAFTSISVPSTNPIPTTINSVTYAPGT